MQRVTTKYMKVLVALILLGITTDVALQSKLISARELTVQTTKAAPTAAATISESLPLNNTPIKIMFTGDINLGRCIAKRTLSEQQYTNDYNYPFKFVANELRDADITVGSLDGSLSDESPPMPCPNSMNLIGPTHMVEGLKFSGFDVITIATNHIKDCGEKGFKCDNKAILDTIDTLTNAGIQPVGAGKTLQESRRPVLVERSGIRFAFLGINQIDQRVWAGENTPGTAPLSQVYIEKIKAEITAAKQIADVVIVLPQWGVEYSVKPEGYQKDWGREFINAGASLVIGNSPHIIQPMEVFSDKLIFYALGNFIFDQEQSFRRESIVVEVNFLGSKIDSWKLHPVSINLYTFQSHWAQDAEAEAILARTK